MIEYIVLLNVKTLVVNQWDLTDKMSNYDHQNRRYYKFNNGNCSKEINGCQCRCRTNNFRNQIQLVLLKLLCFNMLLLICIHDHFGSLWDNLDK